MRKVLFCIAIMSVLEYGCRQPEKYHEGPIYVLYNNITGLRDLLVVEIDDHGALLNDLKNDDDINRPSIIGELTRNDLDFIGRLKMVKLENGVLVDPWGRKLRIQISIRPESSLSPKDLRRFSLRVWSVGKNGIDENGSGDDINSWSFPKRSYRLPD